MTASTPPKGTDSMAGLLDRVRAEPGQDTVTLGQILTRIGRQSFAALLMVIALMMVSPLSSVPLLPAFLSIIVVMAAGQAMVGRRTLWLPRRVLNRELSAAKLHRALDTLDGPARWLDRRRSGWWWVLTVPPLSYAAYAVIAVAALSWPPLSLIPLSTTIIAVGMTLIAAGLALRDGIFVVAGYTWLGLIVAGGVALWAGLV